MFFELLIIYNLTVFLLIVLRISYHYYYILKERYVQCVVTSIIKLRLSAAFRIFLCIEFIVFFSLFWAYFHFSLTEIWPPIGVIKCDPFSLPLLNTCLLLRSAVTLTVYHNYLVIGTKVSWYLRITIFLGCIFIYTQYVEYKYHLEFRLSDGIYGRVFYSLTGFHGSHVLIGIYILITVLGRLNKYALCNSHIGVTAAIWYWHFVDVIWIFLFLFVYIY